MLNSHNCFARLSPSRTDGAYNLRLPFRDEDGGSFPILAALLSVTGLVAECLYHSLCTASPYPPPPGPPRHPTSTCDKDDDDDMHHNDDMLITVVTPCSLSSKSKATSPARDGQRKRENGPGLWDARLLGIFLEFRELAPFVQQYKKRHRHPGQMIHPRNSVQHLADRVLSPATSPGLPFTGPLHALMDHMTNGMD
ncbi:hypothetical protein FQN60_013668, partial [Etheostoma spectabile]